MFVLARRVGEAIQIGDIRVVVTRVSGKQVRLGFKTPHGARAYREEVYSSACSANQAAQIPDLKYLDQWSDFDESGD